MACAAPEARHRHEEAPEAAGRAEQTSEPAAVPAGGGPRRRLARHRRGQSPARGGAREREDL